MARGFGATVGGGTSDIITTGLTASQEGKRTYSFWTNIAGTGGGSAGRIFDNTNAGGGGGTNACIQNHSTGFLTYSRGFSTTDGAWHCPLLTEGSWQHVMLSFDAGQTTNPPAIYVNGASQTITTDTAPVGTARSSTSNYTLGNRALSQNRDLNGALAWFTVWDGVLLNAGEGAALAAGAMPFRIRPGSIVCCLPLWGLASPEPDFHAANGTATVTGTTRRTDPPTTLFTAKGLIPPLPLLLGPAWIIRRRERLARLRAEGLTP